jgi:cobalt-precorrin 5A hydrolase
MGAEYVAGLTGATAVITTATDVNGMVSPDMLAVKLGAVIDDMSICKTVTAVMVNGGRVALLPYNDMDIPHPYVSDAESADA